MPESNRPDIDLDTKFSISGANQPWGATEHSLREAILTETGGDASKWLCGDATFKHLPAGGGGGGGGTEVAIGDYTLFVDEAGSLMIRTPDDTIVPLVLKT